jgi:hypothetical protein
MKHPGSDSNSNPDGEESPGPRLPPAREPPSHCTNHFRAPRFNLGKIHHRRNTSTYTSTLRSRNNYSVEWSIPCECTRRLPASSNFQRPRKKLIQNVASISTPRSRSRLSEMVLVSWIWQPPPRHISMFRLGTFFPGTSDQLVEMPGPVPTCPPIHTKSHTTSMYKPGQLQAGPGAGDQRLSPAEKSHLEVQLGEFLFKGLWPDLSPLDQISTMRGCICHDNLFGSCAPSPDIVSGFPHHTPLETLLPRMLARFQDSNLFSCQATRRCGNSCLA